MCIPSIRRSITNYYVTDRKISDENYFENALKMCTKRQSYLSVRNYQLIKWTLKFESN